MDYCGVEREIISLKNKRDFDGLHGIWISLINKQKEMIEWFNPFLEKNEMVLYDGDSTKSKRVWREYNDRMELYTRLLRIIRIAESYLGEMRIK